MCLSESGTPVIAEPNIVSLIYQNERRCKISVICDPEIHVAEQAMHHQHSRLLDWLAYFRQFAR